MAVVYKATDEMLERVVAVKILREDYARDEDFRERFKQEARAAANLSHPNIVTVHDFGLDEDQVFIVIEYIDGTDLKSLIRQKGQLVLRIRLGSWSRLVQELATHIELGWSLRCQAA